MRPCLSTQCCRARRHPSGLRLPVVLLAVVLVTCAGPAGAQQWETAANHAGDPLYVQPPYEVVFVATKVVEGTTSCGGNTVPLGQYDIGTDVLAATKPSGGNTLWVVTRTGSVVKLFPRPVHSSILVTHPDTGQQVPLIDTPSGQLDKGSVVEPNVSEDGKRIIFSYFHDATLTTAANQGSLSLRGADLYTLDLTALLANPQADPDTFPVRRLTFRQYDPSGAQSNTDKNKDAMNQLVVNNGNNGWGTVFMHGIELRTFDGLKMLYVSGAKRLMNSNDQRNHANYNTSLEIADIEADGSLGAHRQLHYYTTTAALSPTPLPAGFAFSYQATTGDGRNWQIQRIDSEGRWSPLIGYGSNPDLFHLGGYCVATTADSHGNAAGDYFLATRYYNQNNNGFGALWKINLADTGINTYDDVTSWGVKPRQKNARKISKFIPNGDDPSGQNGQGQWYGKITSPRCGRPDELYFAYTPTSANGRLCSSDGKHIYHAYIAFRDGFEDFDPTAVWAPATNDGLRVLVDDSSDLYTLAWPLPVLSWYDRTGKVKQDVSPPVIDRRSPIQLGEPFAMVGTSAIYNTDRRPYDCWLGPGGGGQPYNPNTISNNQYDQITGNFDAVTKVMQTAGQPDLCKALTHDDVLGIQVSLTSNKINHNCCNLGYETDGSGDLETVKVLGVYDVRGQSDGSFKAMIPSHVPFEFQLLDIRYGMRLVDVRSWHSLQPRETRTNCGGCHQHVENQGIPFAGTVAATSPPLDMVTQTQTVSYDAACNPVVTTSTNATEPLPEWKQDVWPGFNSYCSSCHTGSGSGVAKFAYNANDEAAAYSELKTKKFADDVSGALGSAAFWAARGERTDGRDNALYAGTNPPYYYNSVHDTQLGLCNQSDSVKADWVRRFGQWIDNHMPRTTTGNFPTGKDRYHPTVDGAFSNSACNGNKLRVGWWDDSGFLQLVEVYKNGTLIPGASWGPNLPNGSQVLSNLGITDNDVIKVLAMDADSNRQWYEKTGEQLKRDCQYKFLVQPVDPLPWP